MSTAISNLNIVNDSVLLLDASAVPAQDDEKDIKCHPQDSAPKPPVLPTRIEHFNSTFDTTGKRTAFWGTFLLFSFALAIASNTAYLYLAFATSYFQGNTLLSTIGLLTAIMGGVLQPFWGRLAEVSARSYSFAGALGLVTLGYAISAGCSNTQALAAGQVIYTIGSTGLSFLQTLIIADLTPLESRGLAYGIISMVYLPFAFISPNIAAGIGLEHWRWGYGMFCIIMPSCSIPFLTLLWWLDRHMPKPKVEESFRRRVIHSILLVDPVGLLLVGFAFSLLLCPLTLYGGATGGWSNPSMIAMEVVGGVIFIVLCIWEWKFAKHPLLPRRIFNRNYALCLFTTIIIFMSSTVYNTYWPSWLWVVQDYSQRQWTYICETGTAALCFFSIVAGLILRFTHRYKYLQISGICISIIGAGVNYLSAQAGHTSTVAVVFAQLLIQGGASFTLIPAQTAFQASVVPEDLAIAVAIYIFGESLAGGIGSAIAGSLWSNNLVNNLAEYVPSLNATDILQVAGDITVARVTEPRTEVIAAYDITYEKIALVTLIMLVVPLISTSLNKEYILDNRQTATEA